MKTVTLELTEADALYLTRHIADITVAEVSTDDEALALYKLYKQLKEKLKG